MNVNTLIIFKYRKLFLKKTTYISLIPNFPEQLRSTNLFTYPFHNHILRRQHQNKNGRIHSVVFARLSNREIKVMYSTVIASVKYVKFEHSPSKHNCNSPLEGVITFPKTFPVLSGFGECANKLIRHFLSYTVNL